MENKIEIHFSPFAPPLHKQLNVEKNLCEEFQLCSDSVNNLYISGIINEKEALKFRKKIIKKMGSFLKKKK